MGSEEYRNWGIRVPSLILTNINFTTIGFNSCFSIKRLNLGTLIIISKINLLNYHVKKQILLFLSLTVIVIFIVAISNAQITSTTTGGDIALINTIRGGYDLELATDRPIIVKTFKWLLI